MFAEGFSYQKGAIFGFGPSANLGTEITMKSSNADVVTLEKLDKSVQVHKILEERNVGETNDELKIKAKENLNNVSRKMVLNKCDDFKKRSFIKIKYDWNEMMKTPQKDKIRKKY